MASMREGGSEQGIKRVREVVTESLLLLKCIVVIFTAF